MATLTYKNSPVSLVREDLTNFLKRFRISRSRASLPSFRYFAVGEYGERTQRPHYHLAMFGVSVADQEMLEAAWSIDGEPIGMTHIGDLTTQSAAYIAGYVVKKLSKKDDSALHGREPEFSTMSKMKGGIGFGAAAIIGSHLTTHVLDTLGDVPSAIKTNGRTLPLGNYLRKSIRKSLGRSENTPLVTSLLLTTQYRALTVEEHKIRDALRVSRYNSAKSRWKIKNSGSEF